MNEVWENRTQEYNNQASVDLQALNKYLRDWGKAESELQQRLQEGRAKGEADFWKSRRTQLESYYEEEGEYASKLNRLKIELEESFTNSGRTALNARLIEEQRVKVSFEQGFYKFQEDNLKALQKRRDAIMEEHFRKNGWFTEAEREAHMSEAQDAADAQTAAQAASLRDTEKQRQIYAHKQAVENKKAEKEASKQRMALREQENKAFKDTFFGVGVSVQDRAQALKDAFSPDNVQGDVTDEEASQIALLHGIDAVMTSLSGLAQQLDKQTDELASKKSAVDTRLLGSKADTTILGSHYDKILRDITNNVGVNGLILQADVLTSLETMVGKGIAYNVEQRAFLNTIKDKIATTFNAADSTLLRLVRIQQQDTTAGRLGMEAALNSFLNNMYETTEYLSDVAASVRSSLEEMESLMGSAQATEIEFQVQKWMGSMYSVGMSQAAVQSITDALGKVAAGDVSGITSGGAGNLVVMGANEAGISISDILTNGLNADETNRLLQAMVNYLAEMADSSSDSLVVQQQLANVYGLKASDLRAITNLADKNTMSSISNNNMTYGNMLNELNKTANTMILRTSMGEILSNVWQNTQYTIASNIANNPALYIMDKVATLLDNTVGGIAIPAISVMGNMVDLETSVADLMRVGVLSSSVLGSVGAMFNGIAGTVAPSYMLNQFGIGRGESKVVERGTGTVAQAASGTSTSSSGYASMVGNASSSDVLGATMAEADDTVNEKMVKAMEAEESDIMRRVVDEHVVDIYNLLEGVVSGEQSFTVRNVGGGVLGGSGSTGFEDTPWGKGGDTGSARLINI